MKIDHIINHIEKNWDNSRFKLEILVSTEMGGSIELRKKAILQLTGKAVETSKATIKNVADALENHFLQPKLF